MKKLFAILLCSVTLLAGCAFWEIPIIHPTLTLSDVSIGDNLMILLDLNLNAEVSKSGDTFAVCFHLIRHYPDYAWAGEIELLTPYFPDIGSDFSRGGTYSFIHKIDVSSYFPGEPVPGPIGEEEVFDYLESGDELTFVYRASVTRVRRYGQVEINELGAADTITVESLITIVYP